MLSAIGSYQVRDELHRSMNSFVYRVADEKGRTYIAKLLSHEQPDPLDLARFEREFNFLNRLDADEVIKAIDLVKVEHRLALITEDFGGHDINKELQRIGALPLPLFLDYACRITLGLQAIHINRLIHRDINPSNVVVNPATGQLKIIDLGIASELALEKSQMKDAGDLEGSLPYISPEQTGRMNRDVDYRTDFYSLGMTFYQMLTGTPPFQFQDKIGYIHAHIARELDLISDINPAVPPIIAEIVQKLIEKNAEKRYQSCYGLLEDLKTCQEELRNGRTIKSFRLAQQDLLDRFEIRNAVYGREQEAHSLLDLFTQIGDGGSEAVLISGYSGIGKSSLVHEIYKPVTSQKAIYAEGKFPQSQSEKPFFALADALNKVIQQILAVADDGGEAFRTDILKRLGRNCGLLNRIIPMGEVLLGKHNEPEIEISLKRQVTHNVLREFIAAVSSHHRGFVLFLDDLQWSDLNTIQFLDTILLHNPITHLLLIGSYRSNEVNTGHPLLSLIGDLRQAEKLHEIQLAPLSLPVVEQMVADTFHTEIEQVKPLASVVQQKSQGNPLFIQEFLKTLRAQKIVTFNYTSKRWEWDQEKAANTQVSGDLAGFISQKMDLLSPKLVDFMMHASFLGHSFTAGDLAHVVAASPRAVAETLWLAVENGLLQAVSQDSQLLRYVREGQEDAEKFARLVYRFQHDKIQQASYERAKGDVRPKIHLQIARQLISRQQRSNAELVHHYLNAKDLLSDRDEIIQVIRLCLDASVEAKKAASYEAAFRNLLAAETLLPETVWAEFPEFLVDVRMEKYQCSFLAGHKDEAEMTFAWLLKNVVTELQRFRLDEVRVSQLSAQGRFEEMIPYGLESLGRLGIQVPLEPKPLAIMWKFLAFKRSLKGRKLDCFLELPLMKEPKLLGAMRIASILVTAAVGSGRKNLFAFLVLTRSQLSLDNGIAPSTPANMIGMAILLQKMNRLTEGAAYSRIALALMDKHAGYIIVPRTLGPYAFNVQVWDGDHRRYRDVLKRLMQESFQAGDFYFMSITVSCLLYYPDDLTVGEVQGLLKRHDDMIRKISNAAANDNIIVFKHLWDVLGDANIQNFGLDLEMDRESLMTAMKARHHENGFFFLHTIDLKLAFIFERYSDCLRSAALAEPFREAPVAHKPIVDFHFFKAMSFARSIPTATAEQKKHYRKKVKEGLHYFQRFSAHNPTNFRHLCLLLLAENARLRSEPSDTIQKLYDEAIDVCMEISAFWGGFASAQAADWHRSCGRQRICHAYAKDAAYLFGRVGAQSVVQFLHNSYNLEDNNVSFGGTTHTRTAKLDTIVHTAQMTSNLVSSGNFEELFHSVQSIAEETSFDKLLIKFALMLMEFSGAQKTMVILKDLEDSNLYKVIDSTLADVQSAKWSYTLLQGTGSPLRLIQYVQRTRKTLLLDAAAEDSDFSEDHYIRKGQVLSILCSPILRAGQLIGIVYLENSSTKGAFTSRHEGLVQVLAHQTAALIHSAMLQRNLENKVKQKTRDLSVVMQHLRQGIFTIGQGGTIQEGYSEYLREVMENQSIYGRKPVELLFQDSDVSSDCLAQMNTVISMVGEHSLSYYANEAILIREYRKQFGGDRSKIIQLDWDCITDEEKIDKIMVTVRDVTELRRIEEQAHQQKEELEALAVLRLRGKPVIANFISEFDRLNKEIEPCLQALTESLERQHVDLIFRHVHTQKGLARLVGFNSLSNHIHELEEAFSSLKSRGSLEEFLQTFRTKKRDVDAAIRKLQNNFDIFYRQGVDVQLQGAVSFMRHCLDTVHDLGDLKSNVTIALNSVEASPIISLIEEINANLTLTAGSQQKESPRFVMTIDDGLAVHAKHVGAIKGMLLHIMQNSLDHGIESMPDRVKQGKPPQGVIQFQVRVGRDASIIEISDDGRGLNLAKILNKAQTLGLLPAGAHEDQVIASQIFAPSFSTQDQVTTTSGRGVGMDAVKNLLEELGGSITIQFLGPRQDDYRPFGFRIQIPPGILCEIHDFSKGNPVPMESRNGKLLSVS